MNFEGIMTALVTPLTSYKEIDVEKFRVLINHQIGNGVDSLLVLGGTGEYTSLNTSQKKEVIKNAIEIVDNRVPVIVGIIDPGLGDAIEMGEYSKKAGADALMVVTPYYVKPTQEGLIEYYKEIDRLNIPILLYNIPHKTGVNMLPETVAEILNNTSNVVGIKECTENFGQMTELINTVGNKLTILAGEEFIAVNSMMFGAKGAVMASANVIPDLWVKVYNLILNKNYSEAIDLYKKNYPIFKAIFMEGNPGPLKTILQMKGLADDELNLPLQKPTELTRDILNNLNV